MATTYLHKNQASPTNANKFTYSVWLKRSKLSSSQRFYQGYESGDNRLYAMMTANDTLFVYGVTGGNVQVNIETTRKFRDTNGWYHVVIKGDSTDGTSTDRTQIWVNGVRETALTVASNINQNTAFGNLVAQSNNTLTISGTESHSELWDGSMSHIHFTDGYAYDASAFGQTDSTTGEWSINTSPSVTYGNTGYFVLKDGNSVTDSSDNSNDFSVGAGTLTKAEDCPDNVFATLDNLGIEAGANGTTFSNGNTTYSSGGHSNVRFYVSNLGATSGKFYCEIKPTSLSSHNLIGVATHGITSAMSNYYFGGSGSEAHTGDEFEWGYKAESGNIENNASSSSYGNTYAANDIIGIAMDLDNSKLYFSKNGVFQNSGAPTSGSTGTGAISITAPASTDTGFYHFAVAKATSSTDTATFQCNFGDGYFGTTAVASAGTNASGIGIFEYDVPAGYTALSTKGLNE